MIHENEIEIIITRKYPILLNEKLYLDEIAEVLYIKSGDVINLLVLKRCGFMVKYYDLSYEDNVLLEAEKGNLTSNDVQILLGNIDISFASNILRELWGRRLLTRKKITKVNGGIKYLYDLSNTGKKITQEIHNKGY